MNPTEKEKREALETAVKLCIENPGLYQKACNRQSWFEDEKEKIRCALLRYILKTYSNVRYTLEFYSRREQWC